MSHSNAIDQILDDLYDGVFIVDMPIAKQALYEAVVKSKPINSESYNIDHAEGYNQALEDWLTNLSLLFGQDGGLEKPKGGSK